MLRHVTWCSFGAPRAHPLTWTVGLPTSHEMFRSLAREVRGPFFGRYLWSMEWNDAVIGKLATVVHAIAPDRPGEVVVHVRGGTETYMAVADVELAKGSEVLVIGKRTARTVEVTPFLG